MNTKDKPTITFFALLTTIFIVISLVGVFFFLKQKEKRIQAEEKAEELLKLKEEAEDSLEKITLTKETIEAELKETKKKLSTLSDNLQEEKNLKLSALDKLEQKNKEIKDLSIRLKEKEEKLSKLEQELLEAKNKIIYLENQLKQLKKEKAELEKKLNIVRLKEIVIKPKKEVAGEVLAINEAYGFIIVNIGEVENIFPQDKLSVYIEEKKIGEVEIIEVIENLASALIISGDLASKLKEKNQIRLIEEADIK